MKFEKTLVRYSYRGFFGFFIEIRSEKFPLRVTRFIHVLRFNSRFPFRRRSKFKMIIAFLRWFFLFLLRLSGRYTRVGSHRWMPVFSSWFRLEAVPVMILCPGRRGQRLPRQPAAPVVRPRKNVLSFHDTLGTLCAEGLSRRPSIRSRWRFSSFFTPSRLLLFRMRNPQR